MRSPATKRCCRCRRVKPLTDFHRRTKSPDGRRYTCKDCMAAIQRDRRAAATAHDKSLAEIEADFRLHAFYVLYAKTYADEKSNTVRFARALVGSMDPIKDWAAVLAWHEARGKKKGIEDADALSNETKGVAQ